jgi:hypothetical protein
MAGVLPQASIDAALRRLIKNPRWVELDERALARGRELFKESACGGLMMKADVGSRM